MMKSFALDVMMQSQQLKQERKKMFEEKHINRFMDEIKELKDKMLEHTEKQEFVDMVSVFANRLEDENSTYVDELCKLYNVVSDVDIADTFVNYSMELVINQKGALEACKILCSLHGITHNLSTALFEILRFKQKRDNFDEEYLKEKLGVCWSNMSKMSKEEDPDNNFEQLIEFYPNSPNILLGIAKFKNE